MLTEIGEKLLIETILTAPHRCKTVDSNGHVPETTLVILRGWLELDGCCAQGLKKQIERLLKAGRLFVADGILQVSSATYKELFESSRVRRPASLARQDVEGLPPRNAGRALYKGPGKGEHIKGKRRQLSVCGDERPCYQPWQFDLAGFRLNMKPPEGTEVLFGDEADLDMLVLDAASHCGQIPACYELDA